MGFVISVLGGALAEIGMTAMNGFSAADGMMMHATGSIVFVAIFFVWMVYIKKLFFRRFRKRQLKRLDALTPLENQTRRDSWDSIRTVVAQFIEKTAGQFPRRDLKREYDLVWAVFEKGAREIREALNDLATIHHDDAAEVNRWVARQTKLFKESRK